MIRLGWLILGYLVAGAGVGYLNDLADYREADIIIRIQEHELAKKYYEIVKWKFENEYTPLPSEEST